MADAQQETAGKLNVFISYSRDDLDFADQLDAALRLYGVGTMLDRHAISGGEDWQRRLHALIREADTVLFVLSPSSAHSDTCAWEVSEAVRLGKRIVPVLCRPLEDLAPPKQLAELNYIFLYSEPKSPGSGFGTGLAHLVTALKTDLQWLREHTRMLLRASEWQTAEHADSRLLFGEDIAAAKAWAARRPKGAPEPTTLHYEFIRASEEVAAKRQSLERRQLEEREHLVREAEAAQKREADAQSAREAAQQQVTELATREALQARKIARRTLAGLVAAVVLAVLAISIGFFAWMQSEEAVMQRLAAERALAEVQEQRDLALRAESIALGARGDEIDIELFSKKHPGFKTQLAQALAIRNPKILDADRKKGWRGPIARIDISSDWGATLTKMDFPSFPPWRPGVVLELHNHEIIIGVSPVRHLDGSFATERSAVAVKLSGMQWVLDASQAIKPPGPQVAKPSEVLRLGDVVWVAPDNANNIWGTWSILQLPLVASKLD